jgi:hypothetical protein
MKIRYWWDGSGLTHLPTANALQHEEATWVGQKPHYDIDLGTE